MSLHIIQNMSDLIVVKRDCVVYKGERFRYFGSGKIKIKNKNPLFLKLSNHILSLLFLLRFLERRKDSLSVLVL